MTDDSAENAKNPVDESDLDAIAGGDAETNEGDAAGRMFDDTQPPPA
jgi:hypothetical protein